MYAHLVARELAEARLGALRLHLSCGPLETEDTPNAR